MNQKLLTKLLASLLVMTLTFTNFILLDVYASNTYATSDNLEKQSTVTNNENVQFDAYFKNNKGNVTHTIQENMTKQDLKLYVSVQVKKGYLKNAKIQILGENNTTSNLKVKSSNEGLEYVEAIEEATNTIKLKQVNAGTQVVLEIPVVASKEDIFDLSNFSKLNNIVLTGTYLGDAGKEIKVNKTIQTRNEWKETVKPVLEQQLVRFIPYNVNQKTGTILQTILKSGIENNVLPIEETKITLTVPKVNGKNPDSVNVTPNKVLTTNGMTQENFLEDSYKYDAKTGIVTITLRNENNENKVSWLKNGKDEFIVTYIYNEKVDTLETLAKANTEIKVYNSVETKVNLENELPISINEVLGQIVTGNIETTQSLSKGYLYAKSDRQTNYNEKVTIDISYPELVDVLKIKQDADYFVNEQGQISPLTIGNINYVYYKTTKINKANFEKILGTEGSVKIVTLSGEEIATINKETIPDENGDYVFNYEQEINQIQIITSKPISTGKLEITHQKSLKGNTDYAKSQIETFKSLKVVANVEAVAENTVVANVETSQDITLVAPVTKIETSVSNPNLSTVVTNENVELRVILKTNDISCDLFKNPNIEIVLPNYISKLNIKDINLLFDNELKIKDYNTYINENGNIVIKVSIEGEQTLYNTDEISKGANLIINTDITLKQLTPTKDDVIKVYVTNELATSYEQMEVSKTKDLPKKGYSQTNLRAVAPIGMVTTNSISGFNAKNETITSMSSQEKIGKLDVKKEARTATLSMNVINNYQNVVNNMVILGRIPTKGSKNADTKEDFKSNLETQMASNITTSGIDVANVKVYYSTNIDASKDLNLESNGWTNSPKDMANVKSYLIVVNGDIATGTTLGFSYNLAIPENLSYNMGAYSNYVVYFNNVKKEETTSEKVVATKVGIETGNGPELEVSISSDMEGKDVEEGKIITYTVSVKNVGKSEVKNVTVSGNVPENTIYTYLVGTGIGEDTIDRTYDNKKKTYSEVIESIPVGETKTITYQVETTDLLVGYDEDGNTIILGKDENGNTIVVDGINIKNIAKATVEGYDAEFTSKPIQNKLVQGYVNLDMNVATIPDYYVRSEGDEVTYTINVKNVNSVTKKKLKVLTTIPEGITYKSSNNGGKYNEQTRQLVWDIEALRGKETKYYEFTVVIDNLEENNFEKTIKIKSSLEGQKQVESNEVSILVQKASLTISQTSDTKSTVSVGDDIIYNFEIKNVGKGEAPLVELTDNLPEGLKYETAQYSYRGKTYNSKIGVGNTAKIIISGLKAGETLNISIHASVENLEDGVNKKQIVNKATAIAEGISEVVSNEIIHTIVPKENTNDPSTDNNKPQDGTYSISGVAWLDANSNGKRDDDEQRMPNIPVILINADNGQIVKDITTGKDKKQVTGSNGEYTFANLKPGKYMVVFLYDSGNYGVTIYKQAGINDDRNSDTVQMNVVYEGKSRISRSK